MNQNGIDTPPVMAKRLSQTGGNQRVIVSDRFTKGSSLPYSHKKAIDQRQDPSVFELGDQNVPRQLKVTNRFEDNSTEYIRRRLRKNKIDHMNFDTSLSGEQHRKYFKGVYQPNDKDYIVNNRAQSGGDEKNFFACWAKYRTSDQTRPPKI